jgi:hypothetical protein
VRKALPILLALTALAAPALARADGDPASDWLLRQSVFVPEDDHVPSQYVNQLQSVVDDAKARGYQIRVALIGTRYDMGSVYELWMKPKPYARFLGTELAFVYKGNLLVVMPNGLAVARDGKALPADQAIVDRIPAPGSDGAALASAATKAVAKLAANHGAIVTVPPLGSGGTGSSQNRDRATIAGATLVVLALLGAGGIWRRRRRRR